MAEIGQVIEEKGSFVVVSLQRQEACAKCGACTAGLKAKEMIVEAENMCNAKKGDMVNITLEKSNFLKAVIIMYVLPLLGLLAGIFVGYLLNTNEIIALIIGFIFLGITYGIIRLNEDKFNNKKYRPIADKVIE